ncbi:MAG: hypothetical protein N5P05_002531 [Chroococcopsis gigantea SAG 12.99]|jgi:hypothetical protein|nr:hypothetical protein [Chroococcopsis gigantea SAG 12.99]
MKRRHFLQFAGSTLATLGITQLEFQKRSLQYNRVLAQGTPRKLALLVGINEYAQESLKLYGCVTDVNLQKELLMYRYGFKEADILTVTDKGATREGILTAFQEHLIKQAKPGDVVVYHYSGHGSEVLDPDKDDSKSGKNSTFVPVDSTIPQNPAAGGDVVIDITGHTLFLLMKAVQTDYMTVVLDSCHSGGGTRGNLRIRARNSGGRNFIMSPAEQEFQAKMLERLNLSPEDFINQRRKAIARGLVLASTQRNELAADASFADVNAGAFTYSLTQYLWQNADSEPAKTTVVNVGRTTNVMNNTQNPLYEVAGANVEDKPMYFLPADFPPAEGIIQSVQGQQVDVWLGGIDSQSIDAFSAGSIFSVIDSNNKELGKIQLESRSALKGKAKIISNSGKIERGTIAQEQIRSLPADFKLVIGLDPSLGKDSDTARLELNKLPRTKAIPLLEGSVNYILGRMTNKNSKEGAVGSIGLFTNDATPLPGSFGKPDETISGAVKRLQPKLKGLLAAQIVKLTLSKDSSKLKVAVTMTPEGQKSQLLANVFPTRGLGQGQGKVSAPITDASRLPVGTAVQFGINNQEDTDIYLNILVIDPTGDMTLVFPNSFATSDEATKVRAGETLIVPNPGRDKFQLVTQEPKGMNEVLIVASKVSLKNALKALQGEADKQGTRGVPLTLDDPVAAMENLLSDIDEGSTSRGLGAVARVSRGVDTEQFATLSISFEVI